MAWIAGLSCEGMVGDLERVWALCYRQYTCYSSNFLSSCLIFVVIIFNINTFFFLLWLYTHAKFWYHGSFTRRSGARSLHFVWSWVWSNWLRLRPLYTGRCFEQMEYLCQTLSLDRRDPYN